MRIGGHNVIAIAAAAIAFWIVGSIWFGLVFGEMWRTANGWTMDDFANDNPAWMALGALAAILSAIGLSIALRWGGLPDLPGAIKRTLWLWLGFGLTCALYPLAYELDHSVVLFALTAGYLLIGWLIMAAILASLK